MTPRINLIGLLTITIYVIQVQPIIVFNVKKLESEIDCSQFVNDDHILDSFPFIVHRNPEIQNAGTTFALTDKNRNIIYMKIVNKERVPWMIYCLKHLSKLDVRNTSFSDFRHQLPTEIEYLASSLTELSIYDTKITHLPEQIGKLKRLQKLKLSNTGLTYLPDSIGDLSLLNFLVLPDNNLKSLPETIKNLRLLKQIILTNNPNLRSVKPLNDLPSLQLLNTNNCPIDLIPRNLPKLFELYMMNNSLTKLTGIETLGNGTDAKKSYYFDKNNIGSVTDQIWHVRNLYRLNLNHNKLDNLPTDIPNVTTSFYLNIQHNQFHPRDLKAIVSKLRDTNPNLNVAYK